MSHDPRAINSLGFLGSAICITTLGLLCPPSDFLAPPERTVRQIDDRAALSLVDRNVLTRDADRAAFAGHDRAASMNADRVSDSKAKRSRKRKIDRVAKTSRTRRTVWTNEKGREDD